MPSLAERLKQLRHTNHVTQKELAQYLKVTTRTVIFYESGERKPDYNGLLAIADYFDVSLDYLTGRTDNPNAHK